LADHHTGGPAPLIHPTAVVASGARIGAGVVVGPHAVVGEDVTLADSVMIDAGAVVTGVTTIGPATRLHAGAVVGGPPQDLGYRGEPTEVVIGARCAVREHATVNAGTVKGRGRTVVGDDCLLMVGCHVGHDCVVGNGVILSNAVLLAGHSTIGDHVLIGGGAAIVQRVRIGAYAFISGLSGVTRDVVPYAYVIGHRGRIDSLNLVGLKRRGFTKAEIRTLLAAYAILFEDGPVFRDRLARLRAEMADEPVVRPILEFIEAGRNRPLLQPLQKRDGEPDAEFLESGL
jgi:UDP-N-acetylglucosamine acyltransferase